MDVVYEIQNALNDEEIKNIINKRIEEETKFSLEENNGETIIGPKIGINPEFHFLLNKDEIILQGTRKAKVQLYTMLKVGNK